MRQKVDLSLNNQFNYITSSPNHKHKQKPSDKNITFPKPSCFESILTVLEDSSQSHIESPSTCFLGMLNFSPQSPSNFIPMGYTCSSPMSPLEPSLNYEGSMTDNHFPGTAIGSHSPTSKRRDWCSLDDDEMELLKIFASDSPPPNRNTCSPSLRVVDDSAPVSRYLDSFNLEQLQYQFYASDVYHNSDGSCNDDSIESLTSTESKDSTASSAAKGKRLFDSIRPSQEFILRTFRNIAEI